MSETAKALNDFSKLGINTQELVDAVNTLLDDARKARDGGESFGAVNWGDLGIVDIEYRLSMLTPDQGPQCVVLIEEAAPESALGGWLYVRLQSRFPSVSVECEW